MNKMQGVIPMTEAIADLKRLIDDLDWNRQDTKALRYQLKQMEMDTSKWYPLF